MIHRNLRPTVLAVLSLAGASNVNALVVEPPIRSAILGRPIEFNLRANLSPGEDASTLCIQADVLQSDALVPPSKIRVQILNSGMPSQTTIRISSAVVVEEPVLNVIVRSGCIQKNTRQFIVLADPPEVSTKINKSVIPSLVTINSFAGQQRELRKLIGGEREAGSSSADIQPIRSQSAINRAQRIGTGTAKIRTTDGTTSRLEKKLIQSQRLEKQKAINVPSARLQLDMLEGAADPMMRLRTSTELAKLPLENSPQRAEAAAVWRVLSTSADDLKRDLDQLKALQVETLALRSTADQIRLETTTAADKLKTAEDQRYKNPVVYSLAALVAILMMSLFYVRSSKGKSMPGWWTSKDEKNKIDTAEKYSAVRRPILQQVTSSTDSGTRSAVQSGTNHAGAGSGALSVSPRMRPTEAEFGSMAYQPSTRDVNVEELFDIQQQADFFISLGQYDQAIEVLNNHIKENYQTSPLVYLDLLSLYHSQDKPDDYEYLATEFSKLFNGEVPTFQAFEEKTVGLEAYSSLLSRIENEWRTSNIINILEQFVFRSDEFSGGTLNMEAYRELLLLHSVVKDISENPNVPETLSPANFDLSEKAGSPALLVPPDNRASRLARVEHTVFSPLQSKFLTEEDGESPSTDSRTSFFQKPVGARIGLDIDLSSNVQELPILELPQLTKTADVIRKQDNYMPVSNNGPIEFDLDNLEPDIIFVKPTNDR